MGAPHRCKKQEAPPQDCSQKIEIWTGSIIEKVETLVMYASHGRLLFLMNALRVWCIDYDKSVFVASSGSPLKHGSSIVYIRLAGQH